jgi:predicted negative regulator of RcsB-dependent stress response
MIDQILNFFKNKYFLTALALLVVFTAVYQFLGYQNKLKNDDEFKKLIIFNEKVINEETDFNELMEESEKFTIFGYKLIVKSLLAQKAIENEDLVSARNIYNQLYLDSMKSNLGRDSRAIINSEIIENIIRINIQLDDFEQGKKFINSLEQNQRNYELEGDFYKNFKKFDEANNAYNRALADEIDEGKINFIKLKKVYSNE